MGALLATASCCEVQFDDHSATTFLDGCDAGFKLLARQAAVAEHHEVCWSMKAHTLQWPQGHLSVRLTVLHVTAQVRV
jgi:hypothetical protein